jgi:hypothetical protein
MRAFEFPLHRVLAWRHTQLGIEEDQLRALAATREGLALAAVKIDLVKARAEKTVRDTAVVEAGDL